ncbi:hypothetical protein [Pseudoroseomonas ludipueritiae]|uniref:UrcA family protein n=1 Tax=Pseudoroseomonas ludipueritiae TaxID=198093 RepID=A0ABR7R397_9PROT|nr:hypothetical protein [Pseudoroseomonas ludipueritiae]MBC9176157.1 hypothetical protein [Pseudoroseomonas ludipueritiae]
MTRITRFAASCTLAAMLGLGGLGLAQPAAAAPAAAPIAGASLGHTAPVEAVRWAQRCRPQTVMRRDRHGRRMRVTREVCRRVWVGPRHLHR